MKKNLMALALVLVTSIFAINVAEARNGRGAAIAAGILGGAMAGAAYGSDVYYDAPVYEVYPPTYSYGYPAPYAAYDYPAPMYYPQYAYMDTVYSYPGFFYAY